MLRVDRLPALADNYMWLLVDDEAGEAVVVDPSEAEPVRARVAELGVRLAAAWCTHHHMDHVGGAVALGVEIVGSRHDGAARRIAGQSRQVGEGDVVRVGRHEARVLDIPGHTLGHIAFLAGSRVFCGDTLFGGGCGRLFEGTPAMMVASLGKLRALPDDTQVHCGHEYTWHNVRFAHEVGVEPENVALAARHARMAADPGARTVPTSLAEEKAANPFLRWDAPGLRAWTGKQDPIEVFAELRARKDRWRA
jgi:hydroxyacylglutathione hydrolase